ncbi:NADH:ubiquinone oxidoreductase subunit F (NADH-binding) [Kribbella orskensis]|uniref:NADH:ubiquinone oxidoreductase subunit F (NADH-binding) n=1 Tax=Kribbella orskensis TaxID=2512216 RepID=A0ABY2BX33_9ACTN|nr:MULTISPECIES: NADH-ubiquinone oxidoreductase-F iron-sulfur binding region domain-containing protein [Kribbella]TCN44384.1 NADH:ubiquinone oxidoreductase subunit F (NADH-binding) [Kribbella sp. VKM Ac-2500]TCO31838.1 NADH:ubiquinone oxidoreductase subunit F (NADH-binding) [Kribbella orskensis]
MTILQENPLQLRAIGQPRLLAGLKEGRAELHRHLWTHGPMPQLSRETYAELATAVGLRGRGGAAFPVALKLADLPSSGIEAVVVNGSESEPLSRKDRLLLTLAPHLVLDGATGLAQALGAPQVLVAVHDAAAASSIRAALLERQDAVKVQVADTPGRFVAGEARAVLSVLDGGSAVPPGRRVLPTRKGYHRRPTFLSNVETFAQLAVLARLGSREFSSTGLSSEPGTHLLTVAGAVDRPGVIETPTGIPLETVLQFAGAPQTGAILIGGYHGRWLPQATGVQLSRPDAPLGAGIVLALGTDTCPLGEVHRVAEWLASQSAGQCGPCVFGLAALVDDFGRLLNGDPAGWHDAQRHLGLVPGRGACAHPDGSARFLASALEVFGEDVRSHLGAGGCGRAVRGVLPVPGGAW